jgi:type I restriction enzyme R subunit
MVGDSKCLALIAANVVAHIEKRTEAIDGKAMVVYISCRICVDVHEAIIQLPPYQATTKDHDVEVEKGKDQW